LRTSFGRLDITGVTLSSPTTSALGLFALSTATLQECVRALVEHAGDPSWSERPRRPLGRLVVARPLFALADRSARTALSRAVDRAAATLGVGVRSAQIEPTDLAVLHDGLDELVSEGLSAAFGRWVPTAPPPRGAAVAARATSPVRKEARPLAAAARRLAADRLVELVGADGLLCQPSAAGPAPRLTATADELSRVATAAARLSSLVAMSGAPALSLPLADADGLPLGLDLIGLPGEDEMLLKAASIVMGEG
jgi:amidase